MGPRKRRPDPLYRLAVDRTASGEPRVSLDGRVDRSNVSEFERDLSAVHADLIPGTEVSLDLGRAKTVDSSLAVAIVRLQRELARKDVRCRVTSIDPTTGALLDLADVGRIEPERHAASTRASLPVQVGESVFARIGRFFEMVLFIGRVSLSLFWAMRKPWKVRWAEVLTAMKRTGTDALPIVALMSLLVGFVTAFSSAIQLRQFGANIYIADLVGIGMTREMGPLMAAILLTGRSGSAFAAEIGTMKISDEIDALTVMEIPPLDYLVIPRILGVMMTLPLLTLFADVAGIIGGALIATTTLDLSTAAFLGQLRKAITLWDVFSGVIKAIVFGLLVAGVGCYRGMMTQGGALGVGRSTTEAVVNAIFLIVLTDSVFVIVFHYLGL